MIHTKECHQPDLTDCHPAKRTRGHGKLRIGDHGPMGRILIDGEPGNDFVAALQPLDGEVVIAKPGKGAFYATDLQERLAERHHPLVHHRCHNRGLCANHDARGK